MTEKDKSSPNQGIWKDRFWNLFVLLVGAILGFGLNFLYDYVQHERNVKTALTLLRQDVEYQTNYCKNLAKGLQNLKRGQFPHIAKKAPTLDRALINASQEGGILLRSHRSPISEHIVSKIDLLPKRIAADALQYYSNIFYCQTLQNKCEEALSQSEEITSDNPAPTCDIYLQILQSCVKMGEELIMELEPNNEKANQVNSATAISRAAD